MKEKTGPGRGCAILQFAMRKNRPTVVKSVRDFKVNREPAPLSGKVNSVPVF
jgi:hypothetical protein